MLGASFEGPFPFAYLDRPRSPGIYYFILVNINDGVVFIS